MEYWKDDIELLWRLRHIEGGRLKLSPITEDQLSELLEMDDQVKMKPLDRRNDLPALRLGSHKRGCDEG
jgi:hypothetical protein